MEFKQQVVDLADQIMTGTFRKGQTLMIALSILHPYLYKVVKENEELNCFYNDINVDRFLLFIGGGK